METKLNELGFTNFEHLRENMRDGKHRKAWSGVYKEKMIILRVIKVDDKWLLDDVFCELKDIVINGILETRSITDLIFFIETHCKKI